jgi:hypothetical protein
VNTELFLATGTPCAHNATLNGFIVGHRISPEMGVRRNSHGATDFSSPRGGNARKKTLVHNVICLNYRLG